MSPDVPLKPSYTFSMTSLVHRIETLERKVVALEEGLRVARVSEVSAPKWWWMFLR